MANYDDPIEMPHSLKELMDWAKTHPAQKPMVRASDDPTSILYNERKLDMPNSLEELQNWARMHHASGGSIDHIAKAMHLARKHFDDGGDAGGGGDEGGGGEQSQPSAEQQAGMMGRGLPEGGGQTFTPDQSYSGQMGRGQPATGAPVEHTAIGPTDFGRGFDVSGANLTGLPETQNFQTYTDVGMAAPYNYQNTMLNAAMYPSSTFGMIYPSLVNKEFTKEGAAGLLGGGQMESGLNPAAINPFSGATGLFQDLGARKAGMLNAVGASGLSGGDLTSALQGTAIPQLGYGLNEIATDKSYLPTLKDLQTSHDAYGSAQTAMSNFERPGAIAEALTGGLRGAYANQIAAGVPSAATTPFAPSGDSFASSNSANNVTKAGMMAALMSGANLADTQTQRLGSTATDNLSDAVNDPNVTAGQIAPAKQPSILDKIFGSTSDRISELEAQGQYAGGDREGVAAALQAQGVDVTPEQLKARIINDNGQQKVDYYTKELSDIPGDMLKALGTGIGGLFNQKQNYDPLTGQYRPDISASVGQEPSPFSGHGGGNQQPIPYIPLVDTTASVAATPVASYTPQTPYIPPANTPYASLGANFIDPRVYQNPYLNQFLAAGGKVYGNNAMGNALRMAKEAKS